MTAIKVFKLDEHGVVKLQYDAKVIERGANRVYLKAIFQIEKVDIGFAIFERGDIFYEWFYADRWYNVFRIESGANGALKGWYCNVTRPAILTTDSVLADDLALDVFVSPDYSVHLMDEDEFAALDIDDLERAAAWQAVEEIRRFVAAGTPPFQR